MSNRAARRSEVARFRREASRSDVVAHLVNADQPLDQHPLLLRTAAWWRASVQTRKPVCIGCKASFADGATQPAVMVMHDLDGEHAGFGAFWGEVQSNVHKALGALGVVTDGSIRDIPMIAPGFQMLAAAIVPSHAYVHVVDFGVDVDVAGMATRSGDLIHADRHGAVVVPVDMIGAMQLANENLAAREAKIIAAARSGGGVEAIKAAMR